MSTTSSDSEGLGSGIQEAAARLGIAFSRDEIESGAVQLQAIRTAIEELGSDDDEVPEPTAFLTFFDREPLL